MMLAANSIRQMLRDLPSLAGPLPVFDPGVAPAGPTTLFEEWLRHAIDSGVREPHAMTLSTVDTRGRPAARTLILKNVTDGIWQFATGSASPKGKELASTPWAALTFYWPALGRQVRIGGAVMTASAEESAADFMARSASARATAWVGKQSEPLSNSEERALAIKQAAGQAGNVCPEWTVYGVQADEVEFWQGDTERNHTRLRYTHTHGTWSRTLLWP
jgi:pyridoxamine 5'-phosphate oxidase